MSQSTYLLPLSNRTYIQVELHLSMTVPKVSTSLELHGAAASSSRHSVLYLPSKSILYASNCILNIATPITTSASDDTVLYHVKTTLRTCTVPRTDWIRSITALALLRPANGTGVAVAGKEQQHRSIVACAFSDGTITLWVQQQQDGSWVENVITGLTANGEISETMATDTDTDTDTNANAHISIADVDGVYNVSDDGSMIQTIVITASAKGVQSYNYFIELEKSQKSSMTTTEIGPFPTSSIKLTTMDNQLLLAVGSALPRNNRIHFYTLPVQSIIHVGEWKHQGSVMGHLDWVSCLDWASWNEGGGMLASGSQDARIRLWRFHPSAPFEDDAVDILVEDDVEGGDDDDDDDEEDDEDLIEEGEARMYIRYDNSDGTNVQSAVTLEALLIGHEEHVTSVAWRPQSSAPCLISSSMDRSILIWMEENEESNSSVAAVSEGTGNVWVPITRVGTAGGVLGGSVGSSLLGFVNALWSDNGKQIVGHGFGGALYFWSGMNSKDDATSNIGTVMSSSAERWRSTPGITGHFRGCSDISWEATEGMYLLSGGLDQTCRLWMRLPSLDLDGHNEESSGTWREVGRPQVHGYDINTIACIGNGQGEMLHRFVSGADEKEARAFDAPIQTMELIQALRGDGENIMNDSEGRVERAFIPSLGLSNRADVAGAMEEGTEGGFSKVFSSVDGNASGDKSSGDNAKSMPLLGTVAKSLPRERDLGVASLWPEVRKLYGHLTEMVCLASTRYCEDMDADVLLASSCKARDAESAAIRVWNVARNVCLDVLKVSLFDESISQLFGASLAHIFLS